MSAQPSVLQQVAADGQRAVDTFLPSIKNPPQPPPPPPNPMAYDDPMMDGVRAQKLASKVEAMAQRSARGLPPQKPQTPEEQFGNVLDVAHTRAIARAIANHPEDQRGRLISEAHDSATRWVASHKGKVIVHGKVKTAGSPEAAEGLAAQIVNDTVDQHDEREAGADGSETAAPDKGAPEPAVATGSVRETSGTGGDSSPIPLPSQGPVVPATPEIVPPSGKVPTGPPPAVSPKEAAQVGSRKPDGHQVTQPKKTVAANKKLALQAAPELHDALSALTKQIPGAAFDKLRPVKDVGRIGQKTGENDPDTLSDYLGAQVSADSPQAKDALVAALQKNFKVIETDDNFLTGKPDKARYPSTNLQVQLSNGSTAEVQIVPKEVQDRQDESHAFYKAGRDAEEKGDTKERDRQWAQAGKIHREQMDKFKARNGLNDHGALRGTLAAAGIKPIKVGGKLFYPLNSEDENTSNGSSEVQPNGMPNTDGGAPPQDGGQLPTQNVPQRFSKGDTVNLRDGTSAEVAYHNPDTGILRVRIGGKNTTISQGDVAE